jgi:hypothetical protein
MAYKRFGVRRYDRWGRLIKTWATGRDYMHGEGTAPAPAPFHVLPATVEEFKSVIIAAGVDPINADLLTRIDFAPLLGPGHLVIRLARPMMIEASEAELKDAARPNYGLPEFYKDMYVPAPGGVAGVAEKTLSEAEKLQAHARRIGDYTLSVCI